MYSKYYKLIIHSVNSYLYENQYFKVINSSHKLDKGICVAPIAPPSTFKITPVHQDPA